MNRAPFFGKLLKTCLVGWASGLLMAIAVLIAPAGPASAHGVFIFAWVDGDRICTDSYFSKKSKVQGGKVSMRNAAGEVLESGLSDSRGGLCFARPGELEDLLFVVDAGEGHRAEFKLRAEDLSGVAPVVDKPFSPEAASPSAVTKSADSGNLEESLRRMVREELQSQLSPIRKALAEGGRDQSPGLREIIGGLGWVVGLFGLAFWWTGRKKK